MFGKDQLDSVVLALQKISPAPKPKPPKPVESARTEKR